MQKIQYRQIVGPELKAVHAALAAGNGAIHTLARTPGLDPSRHLQYRRAVLGLRSDCTDDELRLIRRHGRGLTQLAGAVEELKPRLLEGFVALIAAEGRRALPRALWNCRQQDDKRLLAADLKQQACLAFWEAVYGYTDSSIYLSTYATRTIRNNLNRHILAAQPRPLPGNVAEMVRTFEEARQALLAVGGPVEFLDVVGELLCRAEPGLRRSPAGLRAVIGSMGDELARLRRGLAGNEPLPPDGLLPAGPGRWVEGAMEAAEQLAADLGLDAAERAAVVAVATGGDFDAAVIERVRRRRPRGPRPGETDVK